MGHLRVKFIGIVGIFFLYCQLITHEHLYALIDAYFITRVSIKSYPEFLCEQITKMYSNTLALVVVCECGYIITKEVSRCEAYL
jgi:hypothetical protein